MNYEGRKTMQQGRAVCPCTHHSSFIVHRSMHFVHMWPPAGWLAPIIGEQSPPFGEQTPPFGEQTPPFGEQTPLFGERNRSFCLIREQKPPNRERTVPIGAQKRSIPDHFATFLRSCMKCRAKKFCRHGRALPKAQSLREEAPISPAAGIRVRSSTAKDITGPSAHGLRLRQLHPPRVPA